MSKFDTMDCTTCTAVLYYGIYLTVQGVRLFLINEKAKREYLDKHKDGHIMVNQYLPYMVSFPSFFVIGIIDTLMMEKDMKNELYVCFAPALMVVINADMALDSIVKRRAVVDDDGFVYEKAYYRSCFILPMDPMKSIIKNIDILTTERQHVAVSKKIGVYLHERFLVQKKCKKNKSK